MQLPPCESSVGRPAACDRLRPASTTRCPRHAGFPGSAGANMGILWPPSVVLNTTLTALADANGLDIGVDDVGHHGRAFRERHIGDGVGTAGLAHDAEGIDDPVPGTRSHAVSGWSRTGRSCADSDVPCRRRRQRRISSSPRRRRPRRAAFPGWARAPEFCGPGMRMALLPLQNEGRAAVPAARAGRRCRARARGRSCGTCTAGCASPRSCRTASMILVMPPRLRRVVVAQAAAVGVERQPADARDQVAVGDEAAALALGAEAEILELHEDGDGEAVVDRCVFDVGRRDTRFLEGARA